MERPYKQEEIVKSIVIIGAGDLGKELVWLIEDINKNAFLIAFLH